MEKIRVKLDTLEDRSYDIHIEDGLLDKAGEICAYLGLKGRVCVVTNARVNGLYGKKLATALEGEGFKPTFVELPDGEEYKTLKTVETVYQRLLEERFERSSAIIALGGGVVGDMAGFAAATYLRGVPYVQIPTTLLSQVDSSVGGKTGVNHALGKNLIGAFYQPRTVIIDPLVLKTLEERELRAGLAEVVKYGVIWDKEFFGELESNIDGLLRLEPQITKRAIARSCAIKGSIVTKDEREGGLRSILNFGHTFGHAIEAVTEYKRYKHGEAVAIGMVMAARLAESIGAVDANGKVSSRISALLSGFGLPVGASSVDYASLLPALKVDKKVKSGSMQFVFPSEIGKVEMRPVGEPQVSVFLSNYAGK